MIELHKDTYLVYAWTSDAFTDNRVKIGKSRAGVMQTSVINPAIRSIGLKPKLLGVILCDLEKDAFDLEKTLLNRFDNFTDEFVRWSRELELFINNEMDQISLKTLKKLHKADQRGKRTVRGHTAKGYNFTEKRPSIWNRIFTIMEIGNAILEIGVTVLEGIAEIKGYNSTTPKNLHTLKRAKRKTKKRAKRKK